MRVLRDRGDGWRWMPRRFVARDRSALVQQPACERQIGESLRLVGADAQRLAEMDRGFVERALFQECGPPVDVRIDAIRADAERRFEMPDGLWKLTQCGKSVAQVGLSERVSGLDPERLAIMR